MNERLTWPTHSQDESRHDLQMNGGTRKPSICTIQKEKSLHDLDGGCSDTMTDNNLNLLRIIITNASTARNAANAGTASTAGNTGKENS
ncbi:hypothetical protein ACU21_01465 [Actinobaculum suis]|uniref:hypothetical protein n=1 Tax=Actinobaculum suis TaxID=1657 RepID=UPI0008086F5D|nr:hypothetical protein [Actinobaculum suis]OCA93142.1 hypothetical protein ACU21_01465 [Actinobaculum suis]